MPAPFLNQRPKNCELTLTYAIERIEITQAYEDTALHGGRVLISGPQCLSLIIIVVDVCNMNRKNIIQSVESCKGRCEDSVSNRYKVAELVIRAYSRARKDGG